MINFSRKDKSHLPSGVPSCARLCRALRTISSVSSWGNDFIKRGTESKDASVSSIEACCGPEVMVFVVQANRAHTYL